MTISVFNSIVEQQLETCKNILIKKGIEYAPQIDRLSHFKKSACLLNTTPKGAAFCMLTKHLVSLSDMCLSNEDISIDKWKEKITDSINYLILLMAIVEEEKDNE